MRSRALIGSPFSAPFFSIFSFSSQQSIPIKLPWFKGLAGATYQNVDPQVIDDVRADIRFDASWDRKTGYETKTMLICPIVNASAPADHLRPGAELEPADKARAVHGIIQCINKKTRNFDPDSRLTFDRVADVQLLKSICAMVSDTINKVSDAWRLGGGIATKERQELEEESLRIQLIRLLDNKFDEAKKVKCLKVFGTHAQLVFMANPSSPQNHTHA